MKRCREKDFRAASRGIARQGDRLRRLRAVLIERRYRLLTALSCDNAAHPAPESHAGDLADLAFSSVERSVTLPVDLRRAEELSRLDDALRKLSEGTYGVCEHCGRRISAKRLAVLPSAALCVTCQQKAESQTEPGTAGAEADWESVPAGVAGSVADAPDISALLRNPTDREVARAVFIEGRY